MRLNQLILWMFFGVTGGIWAQQSLNLEQCYQWAQENHPLSAQEALLNQQNDWEKKSLLAQKYPQLNTEAQATYQSDVVSLPISLPNIHIDTPDKDQYKATLTAGQLIYNGGLIDTQIKLKNTELLSRQKENDIQLHELKNQINVLYFNILLSQEKMNILDKNEQLLNDKKNEIQKLINAGTTYEAMLEPIEIKLLELSQSKMELATTQGQLWGQMEQIIGKTLARNTILELPKSTIKTSIPRVEYQLMELQSEAVDTRSELLKKQTSPRVTAFATAGYGKPGLNMLDNSWQDYYIAGVKLQWNAFDFGANKKQRQALEINKDIIANKKEVFQWQQDLLIKNHRAEIEKYKALIATDNRIIVYRQKMLETAEKQLKHELITPADYTQAVIDLQQAEINLQTHKIQQSLAITQLNTTLYD
jgi:outer membrane protein TolC